MMMTSEDQLRAHIGAAHRIVVKFGSSSLTTAAGGIDTERLEHFVEILAREHHQGRQVVLVSSGAVAAGLAPLQLARRPRDLANIQAAASVGQGLLIQHYNEAFLDHSVQIGQVLLTVDDVTRQSTYRNAFRTIVRLLHLGVIPIVNENDTVATHELRFGDNDRLAALVAGLVRADSLIICSDVDALYTHHPSDPQAKKISFVEDCDGLTVDTNSAGSSLGTGGMATKIEAASIATHAGIPVLLSHSNQLTEALQGRGSGTVFAPARSKRISRRLLWIEQASVSRGSITLDQGAVKAVTGRRASLLAVGITSVDGSFHSGDPVDLLDSEGVVIAHGLTNYSASDLLVMMGKITSELADSLGAMFSREVVHADVLAVTAAGRAKARNVVKATKSVSPTSTAVTETTDSADGH